MSTSIVPFRSDTSSSIWSNYCEGLESKEDKENHTTAAEKTLALTDPSPLSDTLECVAVSPANKEMICNFFNKDENLEKLALRLHCALKSNDQNTRQDGLELKKALKGLSSVLDSQKKLIPEYGEISKKVTSVSDLITKYDNKSKEFVSQKCTELFPELLPLDALALILNQHADLKDHRKFISISKDSFSQFSPSFFNRIAQGATYKEAGFKSKKTFYLYLWSRKAELPNPNLTNFMNSLALVKASLKKIIDARINAKSCHLAGTKVTSDELNIPFMTPSEMLLKLAILSLPLEEKLSEIYGTIKCFPKDHVITEMNQLKCGDFSKLGFLTPQEVIEHFGTSLESLNNYNSWELKIFGDDVYKQEFQIIMNLKDVKSIKSRYLEGILFNPNLSSACISLLANLKLLEHMCISLSKNRQDFRDFPASLNKLIQLKSLKLKVDNSSYEVWMSAVSECTQLEKLSIELSDEESAIIPTDTLMMLTKLSNLRELHLYSCNNPKDLIELCKTLSKQKLKKIVMTVPPDLEEEEEHEWTDCQQALTELDIKLCFVTFEEFEKLA